MEHVHGRTQFDVALVARSFQFIHIPKQQAKPELHRTMSTQTVLLEHCRYVDHYVRVSESQKETTPTFVVNPTERVIPVAVLREKGGIGQPDRTVPNFCLTTSIVSASIELQLWEVAEAVINGWRPCQDTPRVHEQKLAEEGAGGEAASWGCREVIFRTVTHMGKYCNNANEPMFVVSVPTAGRCGRCWDSWGKRA